MSISDIKNELSKIKTHKVNEDIKPKTINDIMNKNIKDLEEFMDNKVVNMFARPWNKLELRLKKIKLKEYFDKLILDKTYTKNEGLELYNNLSKNLNIGKKIKLVYKIDKCAIESIEL